MVVGHVELDVTVHNPTQWFIITGAFHTTTDSIEINKQYSIGPGFNVFKYYPSFESQTDQLRDGCTSLVEDPADSSNTIFSMLWSTTPETTNSTVAASTHTPYVWIFSLSRDLITFNFIHKFAGSDLYYPKLQVQSTPQTLYMVLSRDVDILIYKLNPTDGSTLSRHSYSLTTPNFPKWGSLAISQWNQNLFYSYTDDVNGEINVLEIDINIWGGQELFATSLHHCAGTAGVVYSSDTYRNSNGDEFLLLSGHLTSQAEADMMTLSIGTDFNTQSPDVSCFNLTDLTTAGITTNTTGTWPSWVSEFGTAGSTYSNSL